MSSTLDDSLVHLRDETEGFLIYGWHAKRSLVFLDVERGVERAIDLPSCQELEDFASSGAC